MMLTECCSARKYTPISFRALGNRQWDAESKYNSFLSPFDSPFRMTLWSLAVSWGSMRYKILKNTPIEIITTIANITKPLYRLHMPLNGILLLIIEPVIYFLSFRPYVFCFEPILGCPNTQVTDSLYQHVNAIIRTISDHCNENSPYNFPIPYSKSNLIFWNLKLSIWSLPFFLLLL